MKPKANQSRSSHKKQTQRKVAKPQREAASQTPQQEQTESQATMLGALQRVKSNDYPDVKRSDLAMLQRSFGNTVFRSLMNDYVVQRHSIDEGRQGVGEEEDEIQAKREDGVVQRHTIDEGRQGVGEEDDEIQAKREDGAVQRVAGFGRSRHKPTTQIWGNPQRNTIQRFKGKGVASKSAVGAVKGAVKTPKLDAKGKLDPAIVKAEKEFKAFLGSSYSKKDYVPDTADNFGKFDVTYNPKKRAMQLNMRIKFEFPEDKNKARSMGNLWGLTDSAERMQRKLRQIRYISSFIGQVQSGWSNKFKFQNVRQPQAVWGKLNPVRVNVNVTSVQAKQHYTLRAHTKTVDTAEVQSNATSIVNFYKGDLKAKAAFNPDVAKSEKARLVRNLPKIRFANGSAKVDSKYMKDLQFVGTYLKRMNNPKFKLSIIGRANATGDPKQNMLVSIARAKAVEDKLKSFGASNHTIVATGAGSAGAGRAGSWRKADIIPEVPKGYQNMQDVTLHEFGHMIGLDDEYKRPTEKKKDPVTGKMKTTFVDKRKFTTDYPLVKKMLGDKYAKQNIGIGDGDRASVMDGGSEVRVYHYSTMWKALYETAGQASAPTPKMTWKDWKVIG